MGPRSCPTYACPHAQAPRNCEFVTAKPTLVWFDGSCCRDDETMMDEFEESIQRHAAEMRALLLLTSVALASAA